ncbi:histidine kinase [Paenibacillus pasadenensis]|uniref:sensor histidine kinase n=1 Tax=Paenibacillus pasadenensis TaxID=217090 RepID=UPI0020401011|nr:histidine kinase [Paenibacillus pasadenensis]MCM3749787.1 histidine kinase [Paenibacillus pasadenensis]
MRRLIDRMFNRMRFKQKLFLSYVVVVIVPILILGFYAYNQSKAMLEYQTLEGIDKNVATVTESIDNSLENYNHTLRSIVYNATFQKIVSNDYFDLVNLSRDLNGYLSPYVNMMKNLDKGIVSITMYTQDDVPEYDTLVHSATRVEQEPWYKEAVSLPYSEYGWFYDENFIATAQFPRPYGSKNTNLVTLRIKASQIFNTADMQSDYGLVIADSLGRIVYTNSAAGKLSDFDAADILNREEGLVQLGQTKLYMAKKQLKQADWTIYLFVPAGNVSAGAGSIIRATLGITLICILILLVIISLFSRTMNRRISMLNSTMKRVEMGDLSVRVQSASRDEIGELTNRFGKMLVRINELIEETYQSKIVQKEAELKALQWQINPHFLYNTLSFINWKALRSDAYEISHVVTSLSRFYRTALNRGSNIIPVRDELDNIRSYIEIIQAMNDYSFDVEFDIDEGVYAYHTINLILQPLVENAIQHGVNKRKSGGGMLHVSASLRGDAIVFAVRDNGPGMPANIADAAALTQSGGYGLKNVNERIKLKFGAEFGISIESGPEQGSCIFITVPRFIFRNA